MDVVFLFAALRFATARSLRKARRSDPYDSTIVCECLSAWAPRHEPSDPVIRVWNETRHVESDVA